MICFVSFYDEFYRNKSYGLTKLLYRSVCCLFTVSTRLAKLFFDSDRDSSIQIIRLLVVINDNIISPT